MFRRTVIPIFSALAVLHTWPMLDRASSRVIAGSDGLLNTWLIASVSRRLLTAPLDLFDINMYYPYRGALGALDHQLGAAVFAAPVAVLSGSPAFTINTLTAATFAAAGIFAAMLVTELTGSIGAGLVGGSLYAFSTLRIENIAHTHVLGNCWLPLALLMLHRYVRQPTWRALSMLLTVSLLLALTTWYYAVIGPIALLLVGYAEIVSRPAEAWLVTRRALVGGAIAALALAATAVPYVRITREYLPHIPNASEVPTASGEAEPPPSIDRTMPQDFSAPVESYVGLAARSWAPWTTPLRGIGPEGSRFFPGLAGAALAGIAVGSIVWHQTRASATAWLAVVMTVALAGAALTPAIGRRSSVALSVTRLPGFFPLLLLAFATWPVVALKNASRGNEPIRRARTYLILAVFGAVLSWGVTVQALDVTLGRGVYPTTLPPFSLLRASARFGTLYLLGMSVLAGFGYISILRRVQRSWSGRFFAAVILILVNGELLAAPVAMSRVGRAPDVYAWLKRAPAGAVLEFPIHDNIWPLYWSLVHEHPISNGFGLVEPVAYHRLKQRDDLSPAMLEHVRAYFHPRYIVVNTALYSGELATMLEKNLAQNADQFDLVAESGGRKVFEVNGPSRGTRVLRSYRPWMLEGKSRIAVTAQLDTANVRGTPELQIWGNGALLASARPDELRSGTAFAAPLPPPSAGGLNVEVVADYKLQPGAGEPLGQTGQRSPADIAVTVARDRTQIQVNGHVWTGVKGYTIVSIDPEGRIVDVRGFNTSWSEKESHALADHLRAMPAGRTVAAASAYDASRALTGDAVEALASLGLSADLRGRFQWAHAGIGIKGATRGTALESFGPETAECRIGAATRMPIVVNEIRVD
jgi:hypothetical protein